MDCTTWNVILNSESALALLLTFKQIHSCLDLILSEIQVRTSLFYGLLLVPAD